MNLRKVTLRYLGWCPGVDHAAKFFPDRDVPDIFFIGSGLAIILLVGAYMVFMQPRPEPGPLILTLNGEEFPDSMFDESYDYTNFYDVRVKFQLLINSEEFASAGTQQNEKTVYEFDDWDEAWTVIEDLEIPNIVIGLAKWLRDGTHLEAGERFYGSLEEYDRRSGAGGEIQMYLGENIPMSTCTFLVYRAQMPYSQYEEFGTNERIAIQKRYQHTSGGQGGIWVFTVELSDYPPYTAILIKAVRR